MASKMKTAAELFGSDSDDSGYGTDEMLAQSAARSALSSATSRLKKGAASSASASASAAAAKSKLSSSSSSAAAGGGDKKKKKKKDKKEKKSKKEKQQHEDAADTKDDASSLPTVQPLGRGVLGGLRPLGQPMKSIEELQADIARGKQQALETAQRNVELMEEQRKKAEELKLQAKLTEDDMQRRAEHLRRQRDLIIAKKKAEREQAVRQAEGQEADMQDDFRKRMDDMHKQSKLMSGEEKDQAGGAEASQEETKDEARDAEERRVQMRIALAARMKRDLLLQEEERLNKMQSDQFSAFDEKLRRVEQLREENRTREGEVRDAIISNLRAMKGDR